MAKSKELEQIKKIYGEKFMHLCRRLFPTLLEQEGILLEVLTSTFAANSRTLGQDIKPEQEEMFKNLIYSKIDVEQEEIQTLAKKSPFELLSEAGYDLIECTSEKQIQSFKKYYKPNEELCTFHGGRLDRCVVFWAVKRNANEIKRENFERPQREDEYGTSVMSIQFSRGKTSYVSIKNRYNHTVNNPDATYGNDLDRIIPGLTQSFNELLSERGMELDSQNVEKFEIPGYTVASDGKYYKYNMEVNGVYFCPGNVIIDNGNVIKLDPEKQILIDYFIIDRTKKIITLYDSSIEDSFTEGLEDIEKIEVSKEKDEHGKKADNKIIKIYKNQTEPIEIKIDENNQIIEYTNEKITEIEHNFLRYNTALMEINLPNVVNIGNNFLCVNQRLTELSLPNVVDIGNNFLCVNQRLTELSLPNVVDIGDFFLRENQGLTELSLPNVVDIGNAFLLGNKALKKLSIPNKVNVDDDFFLLNNRRFGYLIRFRNLIFSKSSKTISSANIAELDKEEGLTTTEIGKGKKIIEKIRNFFINMTKDKERKGKIIWSTKNA